MKSEIVKEAYTYTIALIVILGGLYIIYQTRLDPPEADVQGMRLLLAGFIGSALTFVFGRASSAGSATQTERAYAAGLAAPTLPDALYATIGGTMAPATTTTTAVVRSTTETAPVDLEPPADGVAPD